MLHRFKTHKELREFVRSPNALLLLKKHLLTKEEVDRAFIKEHSYYDFKGNKYTVHALFIRDELNWVPPIEWDFSYNTSGELAAKGEITTISVGMRFIQCSMRGESVILPVEINGRGTSTTTDIIKTDALSVAEEVLLATYLKTLIKNV
jgi:hypothetical protein